MVIVTTPNRRRPSYSLAMPFPAVFILDALTKNGS